MTKFTSTIFVVTLIGFTAACASAPVEYTDRRVYSPPPGQEWSIEPTQSDIEIAHELASDGWEPSKKLHVKWYRSGDIYYVSSCSYIFKARGTKLGGDITPCASAEFFGDVLFVAYHDENGTPRSEEITPTREFCNGRFPRIRERDYGNGIVSRSYSPTSGGTEQFSCSTDGFRNR